MVIWGTRLLPKSEYIPKEELKLTLSDGKLQSYTNVCIYTEIFILKWATQIMSTAGESRSTIRY